MLTKKEIARCLSDASSISTRLRLGERYVSPGESAYMVLNFLMDAMAMKADQRNPFRGIPVKHLLRQGSALHSQQMKDLLEPLGIAIWCISRVIPRQKAASRRGSARTKTRSNVLRVRETGLDRSIPRDHPGDDNADNIARAITPEWMDIHKVDGQLREFDDDLRKRLGYTMIERVVNPRGRVSIDGHEYYVARTLNGELVSIYTLMDGAMKAVDRLGVTYELKGTAHQRRMMAPTRQRRNVYAYRSTT